MTDMNKIAIHQPNYLPFIGFFQKMISSDIFVLLDIVQFSKGSFTQRTKIRIPTGSTWRTIPLDQESHFKLISDIKFPKNNKWKDEHMISMFRSYSKSPYFDEEFINTYYKTKFDSLCDFNEFGILYLREKFGINTKVIRASELDVNRNLKSSELLIDIIKVMDGDEYISGSGGRNYMDEKAFGDRDIILKFCDFIPFTYEQRWPNFEPYLSSIDLLFNLGPEMSKKALAEHVILNSNYKI